MPIRISASDDTRPESIAAIVNGAIVLIAPFLFLAIGATLTPDVSDTSTTVRAPGGPRLESILPLIVSVATFAAPFAMLTGWRTWIYARRWRVARDRGWRAVLEAGAAGVAPPLMMLAPGIVFRPLEAPPYVIAYGGIGLLIGLTLGMIFRMTALLVMKLATPHQL